MKAWISVGLLSLVLVVLASPVRAEYAIEAACGTAFLYPQVLANTAWPPSGDLPNGRYFSVRIEKFGPTSISHSIGLGASIHPFVREEFSGPVPAVWPPTWYVGQTGDWSEEYWTDFQITWHGGKGLSRSQLPIKPRAGFGVGLFLYREGEMRWYEYDSDGHGGYNRREVSTPSSWKPLALKAECKGGLETALTKRITLAFDLLLQLQAGLKLRNYSTSSLLESEWVFSVGYQL